MRKCLPVRRPSLGVVMMLMVGMVAVVGMAAIWDILLPCRLVRPFHLWPAALAQASPSSALIFCLSRFHLPHRLMLSVGLRHFFVLAVMIMAMLSMMMVIVTCTVMVLLKCLPCLSRARKRPT